MTASYDPAHDHLLLFDGVCHLCEGSVKFVLRHDKAARVKFAPIQSELGRILYSANGLDPEAPHTMLFITPRGAFKASTGALELAWALGGWWRLATIFKLVPRPLRDIGYYFIAKNRYRWFGKHDACMMPTPELRARMLS